MAKIPAYKQMYTSLKKDIKDGKYKPGTFLPTEAEMEAEYGVSRTTVRKAISLLTNEGYLSVTQGRGTEVQDISTSQHLNKITSFTETLRQRRHRVTTQGLALEKIPAPSFIRDILSLKEGDFVYHIQRVQCADGKPICIIENYLAANLVPDFTLTERECSCTARGSPAPPRDRLNTPPFMQWPTGTNIRSICPEGSDRSILPYSFLHNIRQAVPQLHAAGLPVSCVISILL